MNRLEMPAREMGDLERLRRENVAMRVLLWQVLEERDCPGERYCGRGRVTHFPRWCAVCRIRAFVSEVP